MSVKAILTEQQKSYTKAEEDALLADYYNKDYIDTYMAPLDTPTLIGVPKAPTAATGTNTTQIATTAFVEQAKNTRVPVYGKGKNLLRNWYFAGGGTGHGVFPVNQRGQSSYAGGVYGISGWAQNYTSSTGSETLNQSYITLASTGATTYSMRQYVDIQPDSLSGKAITVSVLTDNGLFTQTLTDITVPSSRTRVINLTIEDVGSLELYLASSVRPTLFLNANANKSVNLIACGMEYGTEQTLCHNEGTDANPVWVLNDVPDYEYELYRCMTSTADSTDTYANKSLATGQELAYVETGTTASRAYAVGEYFCWHGLLYRAKTAIGNGDTFTENTNCKQVTEGGFNSVHSVTVNPLTIEATSYITNINQCRAYTVGRIAYVFISCQIEATPVALINLIKGIPRPYGNTMLPFSSATSSGTTFALAVSVENGVAYIRKGSNSATTTGWYTGTISYPIA